jgi:ribose transport system permease protein
MSATTAPARAEHHVAYRRRLRAALPVLSFLLVLAAISSLNPRAISYLGFNLMLNLSIPLALATLGQMFVIVVNDIDLSIGFFVSFVGCVTATLLADQPVLGVLVLVAAVGVYALVGALIHLRNLPSIVLTLGMSFVWQGLSLVVLPTPGGHAPAWLHAIVAYRMPFVPLPIVAAAAVALVVHLALMGSSYGVILRGTGGNPHAIGRAGWSLLKLKMIAFALAGLFGVFSGLTLIGLTTAADANLGNGYTLLSIAGVILGGGEFVGGRVSPTGAVLGALTLTLASSSLLSFMHIPPDWQVGANGAILIIILALRAFIGRQEA